MKIILKELIESKNGTMIHFDEEVKLVLWQRDNEFVVHNVVLSDDKLNLENGNYLNSMEDAMLKYLARKGKRLNISIGISENDYDHIRDNYTFDWSYEDKNSGIIIDVKVMSDELWNEEEEDLTIEDFDEIYKPVPNHFTNDEAILHFETYGEELEFVKKQPNNKIWTIVDNDNGNMYLVSGFHLVDSVSYVVTEKEWTKEMTILYHKDNIIED